MANRLQHETSPYLLQHQDNPVDWYPWGEEALKTAQETNKPILLSIGYSACHWCHVMAHESFEHEPTAQMMNELFINIKVDREERPDVDDIYMGAVQAMTGQGGWPMTVFLLPDGRPFYGGTYFPRERRYGVPAFQEVMTAVHDAYVNRREGVEQNAEQLTGALDRSLLNIGADDEAINSDTLDEAVRQLSTRFDSMNGGFSSAPKFPQPMNLEFLLTQYARNGKERTLEMVRFTLEKMAKGGIYDQIGGGFARYSVDDIWLVPHFEKMLYDNAQLSRVYLHAYQITGDDYFKHIAQDIYDYILREMTSPQGGFYSATDADSEGEEGKFFVWSLEEIQQLLSEDDAKIAIEYFGITRAGNFEGHNILFVTDDDDIIAGKLGISEETLKERVAHIKDTLYATRSHRIHPGLDDKILTSWNGMMIASLAEGARVLKRADYRQSAIRAGQFILDNMLVDDDRLLRTHKDGHSKLNGYLEDYANIIDAFIELYQLTFDDRWFVTARKLADRVLTHFACEEGGFYDTSDDHEKLIVRPRNVQDNAVPSGNGMMFKQLLRLSAYTGDERYEQSAHRGVKLMANVIRQYPSAFAETAMALSWIVTGIKEVALVGNPDVQDMQALLDTLNTDYQPDLIRALAVEDVTGEHSIPLLNYRSQRNGVATAYICRNFTCRMPVTQPEQVRELLQE